MLYQSRQPNAKSTNIEMRLLVLIFAVVFFVNTPTAYLESVLYPYIFNKVEVWSSVFEKETKAIKHYAKLAESEFIINELNVDGDTLKVNQLFDLLIQTEHDKFIDDIALVTPEALRQQSRYLAGKLDVYYFEESHRTEFYLHNDSKNKYTVYYPVYDQQTLIGYIAVSVNSNSHTIAHYDNVYHINEGKITGEKRQEQYPFDSIHGYDEDIWIKLEKASKFRTYGSMEYHDRIFFYSEVDTVKESDRAFIIYLLTPTETFLYYLPYIITFGICGLFIGTYIYYEFYRRSRRLEDKANLDELTGLYNRTYYNQTKSKFLNGNYYIGILDIDHFKSVNDNYGHDVGDVVIKKVAQSINAEIREKDYAFRIGGEEFVIILKSDSYEHAEIGFERIRDSISSATSNPVVTASLGFTRVKYSADKSFKVADQQLYQAKKSGRNQSIGVV